MSKLTREEFDLLSRRDLYTFVQRVFRELKPTGKFHGGRHLEYVCQEVASLHTGDSRRLVLNMAPRNLKSMIVVVAFVAWVLGHDPSKTFLIVSYGQKLPQSHAGDLLMILKSGWYRQLFPATQLHRDFNRADDFRTSRNGRVKVESLQGGLTGFGADYIILDDPMKPLDAYTEHSRRKVNETIQNTVLSRQDGVGAARVILVGQRIHEDDPTGYLMARQPWRQIKLPAIAEEDERYEFVDAFGRKRVFARKAGEVLNPAYESLEELLKQKEILGDYVFAAQYQQRPAPMGGGIFKVDWFQQVPRSDFPEKYDMVVQSWDTAVKDTDSNDFSVCTTWGISGPRKYLIDVFRQKLEFTPLKLAVLMQRRLYTPNFILVEDRASGQQLVQVLREERMPELVPIMPTLNKQVRAMGQTPAIKDVFLPTDATWVESFLLEVALFPKGRHDDQVDSMTQALEWLRDREIPSSNFFQYMAEEKARAQPQQPQKRTVRMQAPPGCNTLQLSDLPNYAHPPQTDSSLKFGGSQQLRSDNGIFEVPEEYVGTLIGAGFRPLK